MAPSMSSPLNVDLDLTYCTVKTGVNDFLDYIALVVSLVIPLILGPGLAGVGQVSAEGGGRAGGRGGGKQKPQQPRTDYRPPNGCMHPEIQFLVTLLCFDIFSTF